MAVEARKTFNILLVEDNSGDVLLMKEVLNDSKYHSHIDVVSDGIEALEFLGRKNKYASALVPDLIIMDLTLPKKSGHETLKEIKDDPILRTMPVVVFTGSEAPEDVRKAYYAYANCYVTKPIGLDQLEKKLRMIEDFWFGIAIIPNRADLIAEWRSGP